MAARHFRETVLTSLVEGRLPPDEMRGVIAHLLRCPRCVKRLKPLFAALWGQAPERREQEREEAIDRVFARALTLERKIAEERREITALVPELRNDRQQVSALVREQTFSALGTIELLLALSFEERYRDPWKMFELAYFAEIAARHLDPQEYGQLLIADIHARVLTELANAYRVLEDFKAAGESLSKASERRKEGTGNLLLLARIGDVSASLESDRRNHALAMELLEEVAATYREAGDLHLAGRALVSRGIYADKAGYATEGLAFLKEGLALLDKERDPKLAATALQAYIGVLAICGEGQKAEELLLVSDLRRRLPEPLNQVKIRWLEGKVFQARRKLPRARKAFEEVREQYLLLGREYDAGLAGLDLVSILIREGKTEEARPLCRGIARKLYYLGIPQEARNAVVYLAAMSDGGLLTAGVVEHVGRFLTSIEGNPGLRFAPLPAS